MVRKQFLTTLFIFFFAITLAGEPSSLHKKLLFTEINNPMYLYNDKSNNGHYFYKSPSGHYIMEYVPVTKIESLYGKNSGEKMFITTITKADYESVTMLFKNFLAQHSTVAAQKLGLQKGVAALSVLAEKNQRYGVAEKIDLGKALINMVAYYKEKYEKIVKSGDVHIINVAGIIKEKQYVTKKGVVVDDMREFYFMPAKEDAETYTLEKEYFINVMEGNVQVKNLLSQKDKLITIKAIFKFGLWDAESETEESRKGDYVAIVEILN